MWDSNILIIFGGTPRTVELFQVGHWGIFCYVKCHVKEEERVRGMSPTTLDKWLKKVTPDDTGLTRPPVWYVLVYTKMRSGR